jgi:hypothetical protein
MIRGHWGLCAERRWSQIVGILAILLVGCSSPPSMKDLVGTYVASYKFGDEQLTLGADGTYEQKFTPRDKTLKSAVNSGTWDIEGDRVRLRDPLVVHDFYGDISPKYGEKKTGSVSLLQVSSTFGTVSIRASANADVEYKKH